MASIWRRTALQLAITALGMSLAAAGADARGDAAQSSTTQSTTAYRITPKLRVQNHDTIIRRALILDGSGTRPFLGDIAIDGDRISYVGKHAPGSGSVEIDAHAKAAAPGFINMLAHSEESLLVDGRALSDLTQGVTLEVMGEDSAGPLSPRMKELALQRESDIHYEIDWTTLGEFFEKLQRRGIAPNVASFVGAGTVRTNVLGEIDAQPTPLQLQAMQNLVRQAMEEGALGITTALILLTCDPKAIAYSTRSRKRSISRAPRERPRRSII